MLNIEQINSYLSSQDLTLRDRGPLSFANQKIKADVLEVIAELIIKYTDEHQGHFTSSELENNEINIEIISKTFSKALTDDPLAAREMDKFFSQPLKYLSFYKVLAIETIRNRNYYTVLKKDILEYIKSSTYNSLQFIIAANKNFLIKNPELKIYFDNFFFHQNQTTYAIVKNEFEKFINKYTNIVNIAEPRRVFAPFINSIAYDLQKRGSISGKISPRIIIYNDLKYNRPNFYNENIGVPPGMTRQEYLPTYLATLDEQWGFDAEERTAIRKVKSRHKQISEYSGETGATEAHHIFTRSQFENLRVYKENLINLTPNEHRNRAHPNSNFSIVDESFQTKLLFSKLESIKKSIFLNDSFYNLQNFTKILNVGYNQNISANANYNQVKEFLMNRSQ
jgi:hypothetical protein